MSIFTVLKTATRQPFLWTAVSKKSFLYHLVVILCFFITGAQIATAQSFVHPGLLHKQSDFDRMKAQVAAGAEPWKSSWDILVANSHSSLTRAYTNPVPSIVYRGFDGTNPENYASLFRDVASAYATALRWKISGDDAYAEKSIAIMNAWSASLTTISGTSDKFLAAGIYGYQFANAAEIMRTYNGWVPADFDRFKNMMLNVFYPMNKSFLETHNGACISNYYANWDLANMSSMISIGVLCDRRDIYNEAVDYFKNGAGNGSIKNMVPYLHGELGQFQESGRDQGHAMLCVALSGSFCEMAWNQGEDLYGYDDNRLLKAYEYIAKYNLGYEVPFTTYKNCTGVIQTVVSPDARGNVRPVWEIVYNHYVKRKGLMAPYISLYAQRVRPEGGGGNYGPNSGGYDQLGYGSLTFFLDEPTKPNNQTITFPVASVTKEYNAPDFNPGATTSSGLPVFYSVLDPKVASVNTDGTIHILKPGSTIIYAQQIGNDAFNAAPVAQQTLTVNQIPGTTDGTWSITSGTITTAITSTSGNPTLTWIGQTFAVGNQVKLTSIVPGGFTPNTTYYVVFASGATFRLSATAGGISITPTTTITNGTGERIPSGVTTSSVSSTSGSPNLAWPGQTFVVGEHIKLTGTVPGGFTANTTYTVVSASANTFQLALRPGGTPINATNTITNGSAQRFPKWLTPTNWSGSVLPGGNNATATFGNISFANIPGVTLDDNVTIGTLSYAAGGTSELTLASGLNNGKLTFASLSGTPTLDMTLINSGARKLFMGSTSTGNSRIPLKFAGTQGLKVITPLYGNSGSYAGLRIQAAMNWDEFSGTLNLAQGNIELHNTTSLNTISNTTEADDVLLPKKQRLSLGSEGTSVLIFTGINTAAKQTIGALDGTEDAYIISKTPMTARPATLVVGADDQDGNFAGTIGRGPLDITNPSFYVDLGRVDLVKTGTGTQVISGSIFNGNFVSISGTNGVTSTITGPNPNTVTVNNGTLILDGNNHYQGVTTVNGGTLTVNGSIRSATSVNAGTFSGSGSSSAAITVGTGSGTGATIAPGNSVGTFTTTGSLSLKSDATFALELNSNTTTFDKIVANSVTLNNATLSLSDLGSNALLPLGSSYIIVNNTGSSAVSGTFLDLPEGGTIGSGVNLFQVSYKGGIDNNDIVLTVIDKTKPVVVVNSNITLELNSDGTSVLDPAAVNNGSSDNYTSPDKLKFELNKTRFGCNDAGHVIEVTLTVTDESGNSASDKVQVTVADNIHPTITAPTEVNVTTDKESCSASGVTLGVPVTADNCGVQSVTNDAPGTFLVGATVVTWTVTDVHGNTATATQTVTVTDNQQPVVSAPSAQFFCYTGNNYTIPGLVASDNCGIASITYDITGATSRSGSGIDASGTFAAGVSTITWTVTDVHSNVSTATTTVTINAKIEASIPDVWAVSQKLDNKNTLYIGYGPTSLTISAIPNGGKAPYKYKWDNDNGSTSQSISVSAAEISVSAAKRTRTYNVSVTDAMGCSTSASITISVLDVTCGNNNDKVMICHNGNAICVASNAVQEHLNHEDKLGSCTAPTAAKANGISEEATAYQVHIYPNPVWEKLNLKVSTLKAGAMVRVYSVSGAVVLLQRLTNTTQSFSVKTLTPGIYYLQVINGDKTTTEKIVKQ
jgi:autotransporter-associated beta strand protein